MISVCPIHVVPTWSLFEVSVHIVFSPKHIAQTGGGRVGFTQISGTQLSVRNDGYPPQKFLLAKSLAFYIMQNGNQQECYFEPF